jgi:transcriptional antiterminator
MYTTNSSEISKNIMTHIFNVYKEHKDTDFIEKYLESSEKDGIKSLIYCISNLFKLMRIFNQDFFMRLLTIISEKDRVRIRTSLNQLNKAEISFENEDLVFA